MRYARRRILLEWRLLSSTKAMESPDFAAEMSSYSLISLEPRRMASSLADGLVKFMTLPAPGQVRSAAADIED